MMHIFEVTAPLGDVDSDGAVAKLRDQMDTVMRFYPRLRDAEVSSTATHLVMRLKVSSHTQWHVSYAARQIASSMLRRVGVAPDTGTMVLVESVSNGRHIGAQVRSQVASEDPI